jgi:hypothetical protein
MAYSHKHWWGADYLSRGQGSKSLAAAFAELNYRGMENTRVGYGG